MATQSIGTFGAPLDLKIRQGATFSTTINLQNPDTTPVNLTGSTIRGQIRKKALDPDPAVAEFDIVVTDALNGQFTMGLTDEITAAITTGEAITSNDSKFVWDLEMEDSLGRVIPIFYGQVLVLREATRL